MAHRADQIIDAIVSAIESQVGPTGVHVYSHRRLTLAEDQDELPAISVDFGEDTPATENVSYIDSLLSCQITGIVSAHEEQDLRSELLDLRRQVHIALMADPTLGLSFVVTAHYGGADEPVVDASGETIIGAYTSTWTVYYRMNYTDPGDG